MGWVMVFFFLSRLSLKMIRVIRLDYAAVRAAFSSIWSNGQVEAQVNCLKLQNRHIPLAQQKATL